ncbi:hypothetical protein H2198_003305 [Neophaeococcomyces mojaviensis]|uniref:Uncharacterized protein n=1 Tax=Neophaeococcomyces mojaviensis TaxID=3383035 RepID=A0ACC3AC94_9EURO|nr:hypothetical protein H2198_003305 [Knufia sp. JES_112]
MSYHDFIVGTFGTPYLFTLRFTPPSAASSTGNLKVLKQHDGLGSHSWLHLSPPSVSGRRNLYATAWTKDSLVAAYDVKSPTDIQLLNTASTKSRSGYICASRTHAYSAGGATGEVFALDPETGAYRSPMASNGVTANGSIYQDNQKVAQPLQNLDFVDTSGQRDDGSTMDFGGLRHGAHSADLSPDGKLLYIADIGRNCIWTYTINPDQAAKSNLTLAEKKISPRKSDGPRHVWPHPNGKYVYCLQEHTSMVDVFEVTKSCDGSVKLVHVQGVRIIPQGLPVGDFWADEVRTSLSNGDTPKYLYASTRGLSNDRKGYVAVYALAASGLIDGAETLPSETPEDIDARADDQGGLLAMFETPTSGGWANAIQPGPTANGMEYIAMTDSEVGYVFVLSWDGKEISEVGRVDLNEGTEGGKHGAATAVWL